MSEPITNLDDAVAVLGALPMPVGPQQPPFPPAPRDFEEKLRQDVARLQGLLAEAVAAKHLADRERDLMRERVSEPFGCAHCGVAKRYHGRRYISSVEMHSWERPADEQVKARMLARRAAWFTPYADRLASLLVARTEDLLAAEARIAELEAERHSTNEALDDAVQELRTSYAERARRETHPGRRQAWRMLAQAEESERVAEALVSPAASRSADKLRALLAGQREQAGGE